MTVIPRPRTIQIYLPKGDPRGLRVAELTTSIVRVIDVPRALLDEFMEMPEAKQVGVYFLINDEEDRDYPSIYIGQTGGTGKRLLSHQKEKDFWNRVLVGVSLTNNLTQTHSTYLEWLGIKSANEAGRYKVENGNSGSKPHTPAPMEADCQEIFATIRVLMATLGQPAFESLAKPAVEAELFYCRSKVSGGNTAKSAGKVEYDATGQYTTEGMVVLKGSKARLAIAASAPKDKLNSRRDELIKDGALKLEGDYYVFQRDVLFKSPSGAAFIVRAASSNGWIEWTSKDGKTLDSLHRQLSATKSED